MEAWQAEEVAQGMKKEGTRCFPCFFVKWAMDCRLLRELENNRCKASVKKC